MNIRSFISCLTINRGETQYQIRLNSLAKSGMRNQDGTG